MVSSPRWASNDLLNLLSDYGLAGFVLFAFPVMVILIHGLRSCWRTPWRTVETAQGNTRHYKRGMRLMPDRRVLMTGLWLGLVAFGLHLLTEFHLHIPALLFMAAAYLGLVVNLAGERRLRLNPVGSRFACVMGPAVLLGLVVPSYAEPFYFSAAKALEARERLQLICEDPTRMRGEALFIVEMVEDLEEAANLDPQNADALADLSVAVGMRHYRDGRRFREIGRRSEMLARQALAIDPDYYYYHLTLGLALWLQNRMDDAEQAFARTLELAPNNTHAWYYWSAFLKVSDGRREEARQAVERALALDPAFVQAQALRRSLVIP